MGESGWFLVKSGKISDEGTEILDAVECAISVEKNEKSERSKWTEVTTDIRTALVIQTRIDDYAYHPNGVIDEIDMKTYDKDGKLIKHDVVTHSLIGEEVIEEAKRNGMD